MLEHLSCVCVTDTHFSFRSYTRRSSLTLGISAAYPLIDSFQLVRDTSFLLHCMYVRCMGRNGCGPNYKERNLSYFSNGLEFVKVGPTDLSIPNI